MPEPRDTGAETATDATRRTRLANERTYLAWWRTGLTAFAVSLGSGKVIPALTEVTEWPYVVVGVGFAILGVAFVAYGYLRQRAVDHALAGGGYAGPEGWVLAALAAAGVVLGVGMLGIVVLDP